jgi:hypothetical protein
MNDGLRNFAKIIRRYSPGGLRIAGLLLFCFFTFAAPQTNVRLAESAPVELLPGDGSGGSEQEESSNTHVLLARGLNSRCRVFTRILSSCVTSTQICFRQFARETTFVDARSFSERTLPLRC